MKTFMLAPPGSRTCTGSSPRGRPGPPTVSELGHRVRPRWLDVHATRQESVRTEDGEDEDVRHHQHRQPTQEPAGFLRPQTRHQAEPRAKGRLQHQRGPLGGRQRPRRIVDFANQSTTALPKNNEANDNAATTNAGETVEPVRATRPGPRPGSPYQRGAAGTIPNSAPSIRGPPR